MGTDAKVPEEEPFSDEVLAEIARRAEAVLDGEAGIPWEQVEADVRQRLNFIRLRLYSK